MAWQKNIEKQIETVLLRPAGRLAIFSAAGLMICAKVISWIHANESTSEIAKNLSKLGQPKEMACAVTGTLVGACMLELLTRTVFPQTRKTRHLRQKRNDYER